MITLKGKYNNATIYTDVVQEQDIEQVLHLLNDPLCLSGVPFR